MLQRVWNVVRQVSAFWETEAGISAKKLFALAVFLGAIGWTVCFFYARLPVDERDLTAALMHASPLIAIAVAIYLPQNQHLESLREKACLQREAAKMVAAGVKAELEAYLERFYAFEEIVHGHPEAYEESEKVGNLEACRPFGDQLTDFYPRLPSAQVPQYVRFEVELRQVCANIEVATEPRNVAATKQILNMTKRVLIDYLRYVAPHDYGPLSSDQIRAQICQDTKGKE